MDLRELRHPGLKSLMVVGLVLVVTGCGQGSSQRAKQNTAVQTTVENGIERIAVPLDSRQDPLVLPMGDRVLVFGGYRYKNGDDLPVKPLADGAVFDAAKRTWTATSPFPGSAPLRQSAAIWTGTEAIVFGTPCSAASGEEGEFDCSPGGVSATSYSPSKNSWREISGVTPPRGFEPSSKNAVESSGLGWTGDEAAFSVSNQDGRSSILLIDPARNTFAVGTGRPAC